MPRITMIYLFKQCSKPTKSISNTVCSVMSVNSSNHPIIGKSGLGSRIYERKYRGTVAVVPKNATPRSF